MPIPYFVLQRLLEFIDGNILIDYLSSIVYGNRAYVLRQSHA